MNFYKRFIISLLLIFLSTNIGADTRQFRFRHYNVENGLSSNTIQSIFQDSKGFIWIGTNDGLNRFDTYKFKIYRQITGDTTSLGNNSIQAIYEDENERIWIGTDAGIFIYSHKFDKFEPFRLVINGIDNSKTPCFSITGDKYGNIWMATFGQGLFKYDTKQEKLYQYRNSLNNNKSINSNYISDLLIDSKERLWASSTTEGLNLYNYDNDSFSHFLIENKEEQLFEPSTFVLFEDSFGNLWIGGWTKGLIKFDENKQKFISYMQKDSKGILQHIHSICEYRPGELMISSDDGLAIYTIASNNFELLKFDPLETRGINDNFIYPVFKDKEGGVWIGTYFGGVNYLPPNFNNFELYTSIVGKNSLSGMVVSKFCEDRNGIVWIGTDDGGLNKFNRYEKTFEKIIIDRENEMPLNIHALFLDENWLWIGTFSRGLYRLNIKTGKINHYTKTNSAKSLNDRSVYSIFKDISGNLWIGTQRGIDLYNYDNDDFTRVSETGWGSNVVDITQDDKGVIWFASQSRGVFSYNHKTKKFVNYTNTNNSINYIPDEKVNCLCFDNRNLWAGTTGAGLCLYNEKTDSFEKIYDFNSAVKNIILDYNDLWITTNKGLFKYNINSGKINLYNIFDGLQSSQFNQNSGIKISNGNIYIGGVNGFNIFHPSDIKDNMYIPPVVFTEFQLFNKNVPINNESILKQSITNTDEIILSHKQSVFSIEFAALSYSAPLKNRYAYMLEGFDKEWVYIESNENRISYTNLSPGNYTFKVKASNNDNVWNDEGNHLFIKITPPWWRTKLAYIIFAILIIGCIGVIYVYLSFKTAKKHSKELEDFRAVKERELLSAKLQFFTTIAHEIRTPVTLISAPIEKSLSSESMLPDDIKENLNIAQKNSKRLLDLINQLLDFHKTEQEVNNFNFGIVNVTDLIIKTIERFKSVIEQKNIEIIMNLGDKEIIAYSDYDAIIKIFSNLLTNALKFAKNKITITLIDNNQDFIIKVKDNGIGINYEEKEKIFTFLYQTDNKYKEIKNGFGIGLALIKMLVEKLNGNIFVDSTIGVYSEFSITLPIGEIKKVDKDLLCDYEDIVTDTHSISEDSFSKKLEIKTQKNTLLIIDDNEEFRIFLEHNFYNQFIVLLAYNGLEAIDILKNNKIDIVISDIMMPDMDGLEMCKIIKTDVQLSHIPVILLTAKIGTDSKIEGLESGADVYIEKPFSVEFLNAQVFSLLSNRMKLREIFSKTPFASLSSITENKTDEVFLKKVNDIIEKNIDNSNFSVNDLASAVNMSRSVLYVKVKAVSGLTPNDFIRLIKLRKAAEYISKGEYKINEICYLVGFNSPSYFAKSFQLQFGVLPKDFNPKKIQTNETDFNKKSINDF